jgi:hypothetical protein
MAVKDPTTFTRDEILPTLESRKLHFLINFEQIVRAHNRDNDYKDDEQADSPSCSLGILSRVLEGATGHPLLGLDENTATQAAKDILKSFLLDRLQSLSREDFQRFQKDYNNFMESFTDDDDDEPYDSTWLANQVTAPQGYVSLINCGMTEKYKTAWTQENFKDKILQKFGQNFEDLTAFYRETLAATLTIVDRSFTNPSLR